QRVTPAQPHRRAPDRRHRAGIRRRLTDRHPPQVADRLWLFRAFASIVVRTPWPHDQGSLLHRIGDTRTLAANMLLALRSDPAHVSLAQAARRTAQRFDFARFAETFTRTAEAAMRVSRGR
ncbi:MAG: hypothetical protein ACK51F_14045, partial [Rhodospirillales bacterium]